MHTGHLKFLSFTYVRTFILFQNTLILWYEKYVRTLIQNHNLSSSIGVHLVANSDVSLSYFNILSSLHLFCNIKTCQNGLYKTSGCKEEDIHSSY